ncbi:MAG: M48 family metallopeptidase [Bdellovibrionaceae bacterium]|nr:M48 family metallopeptidase [Pseudobdellovibrionaceae bacterium]
MSKIEFLQFENLEIKVERKSHRRSVTILLAPKKPIIVRAGLKTPPSFILSFIKSKQSWIEKNLENFKKIESQFPEKKIKEAEVFPFRGHERQLRVVITPGKKYFVSLVESHLLLHVPINEWNALSKQLEYENQLHALRDFYKREAMSYLSERIAYWAREMSLFPSAVKFREQKKRWGSCSARKIINLNWKLILFSDELTDYVLIHELAHLQHLDHSADFWNLVQRYCPNYKKQNQALKNTQALTDFLNE